MRTLLSLFLASGMAFGGSVEMARADGGTVRASTQSGAYLVTVFTAPTPWRVGSVEVSVLVQDAATKEPISNIEVLVRMWSPGEEKAEHHPQGDGEELKTVRFDLPASGRWRGAAIVSGPTGQTLVPFEVEAAEAVPPWLSLLPWVMWPFAVVLLFVVHQILVRRRTR